MSRRALTLLIVILLAVGGVVFARSWFSMGVSEVAHHAGEGKAL